MSWQTPTADDVLSEFTPTELASITTLMGGAPLDNTGKLAIILTRVVAEVRGYIDSGGYTLDVDTTKIPGSLFNDAIAICRWRFLISAPEFRQLQTEERQKAYDDSLAKLNLIAQQKFVIENPLPDQNPRTGLWNSENKLIMRTHPIPTPATQFTPQIDTYANPDAPSDRAPTPP